MTTAHRPTWKPAVGGSEQGGNKITVPTRQYSSKDIPGYTSLKSRVFAKQEKDNQMNKVEDHEEDLPQKKVKMDYYQSYMLKKKEKEEQIQAQIDKDKEL